MARERLSNQARALVRSPTPDVRPSDPAAPGTELHGWLCDLGFPPESLVPLAGDVSARRYLRLRSRGEDLIVALYPESMHAACRRFRATTELLEESGVRVPAIHAADCGRGWMLLEDLGDETLYTRRHRSWQELQRSLEEAARLGSRIAGIDPDRVAPLNPPLDGALLERELQQTWRAFLEPRRLIGGRQSAAELEAGLAELCRRLDEEPRSPCHRDFMARNLVPLADGRLAVLDHQDLRLGPPLYDLASLLNDSLFPPPRLAGELLGPLATAPAYRRAAAQRALKAVGTFARFAERGDPRHLGLIPPTLGRALDHLLRLPETAAAVEPLAERWRAIC